MAPSSQSFSVLAAVERRLGVLLQQRQLLGRQGGDLADRHGADVLELNTVRHQVVLRRVEWEKASPRHFAGVRVRIAR